MWKAVMLWVLLSSEVVASDLTPTMLGVSNSERAEYNWTMHCLGCHGANAGGSIRGAPNMAGVVAQFLDLEEGRAYLGRVPGVAFVSLPDDELAELLNWVVQTFDAAHMPSNFTPYTANEMNTLRRNPLISEAFSTRQRILEDLILISQKQVTRAQNE